MRLVLAIGRSSTSGMRRLALFVVDLDALALNHD